jgi:hypothetical protein
MNPGELALQLSGASESTVSPATAARAPTHSSKRRANDRLRLPTHWELPR